VRAFIAVLVMVAACAEETNLPLGASCDENAECASGSCVAALYGSHPKSCQCAHDTDCPGGLVCKLTIDSGRACLPAGTTGP